MTGPTPLRVTPAGLLTVAQRCSALAATVAPSTPPAVSSATWQSTGAACSTVNTGVSKTGTVLKSRMTANANNLTKAAGDYANQDDHSATALTAAGSHLPSVGSGGDGGAGGMTAAPRPGVIPTGSGGDGGAAGLGIPR